MTTRNITPVISESEAATVTAYETSKEELGKAKDRADAAWKAVMDMLGERTSVTMPDGRSVWVTTVEVAAYTRTVQATSYKRLNIQAPSKESKLVAQMRDQQRKLEEAMREIERLKAMLAGEPNLKAVQ